MRRSLTREALFLVLLSAPLAADESGVPEPSGPPDEPAGPGDAGAPPETGAAARRGVDPPPVDGDTAVLDLPDNVHDWGKAYKGEVLEHTFTVRNTGGAVLEIRDVKASCGCTTARDDYRRSLAAGGETAITLVVDTSELKGGPTSKYADVLLTNGVADDARLTMKGEVVELLLSTPAAPRVELIRKGPESGASTKFTLHTNLGKKVKITGLAPTRGLLHAELKEIETGSKFEVTVKPAFAKDHKASFQTEVLQADVEVDGRTIALRLPVTVHVKERIDVLPAKSIYFAKKETESLSRGSPPTKTIEIQSLGGDAHRFTIAKVTSSGESFRHEVETIEDGKRYRLRVTVLAAPPKPKRFVQDAILIATDDPEVPLIKVPAMAQF